MGAMAARMARFGRTAWPEAAIFGALVGLGYGGWQTADSIRDQAYLANGMWRTTVREFGLALPLPVAAGILAGLVLGWPLERWRRVRTRRAPERGWPALPGTARRLLALAPALALLLPVAIELDRRINAPDGPPVVLIVVDTLRADALGVYGYERDTSPNLDAFAREAVVFETAIAAGNWTAPSTAALLTSRYPVEVSWTFPPVQLARNLVLLAEIFRENNYRTHAVVSHLYVARQLRFDQGFEVFDQENANGHRHISSPSITAKALDFLDRHGDEKFFLMLHYFDPHSDYLRHWQHEFNQDSRSTLGDGPYLLDLEAYGDDLPPEDKAHVRGLYDSEVRFTDEHIGRVLDALRERGLYDEALIVFTADHGEAFWERGILGHRDSVHQEQIRVPLIIKPPYWKTGRVDRIETSLIDVAPTIREIAGLRAPRRDVSWGRPLDLSGVDPERSLVLTDGGWLKAVIRDGWKLIYRMDEKRRQLYDLRNDPGERVDLAERYPEKTEALFREFEGWKQRMDDHRGPIGMEREMAEFGEFSNEDLANLNALGYIVYDGPAEEPGR